MKKTCVWLLIGTMLLGTLAGCGDATTEESKTEETVETVVEEKNEETVEVVDDEAAAKAVADLIDAIYVQKRTDETDAQCEAAKKAWDALTDAQKELVEGEEADPDYFGRDTGDASLDNPGNADGIGANEILVVSFGTSFNDSRAKDIYGVEQMIEKALGGWSVRRAFTAQIIINHVQARDGEKIDNVDQALERAVANGVKNLLILPTHLMKGAEYDELCEAVEAYQGKFDQIEIASPLLGEVGKSAEEVNGDKLLVADAIYSAAAKDAGFADNNAAIASDTAFVFMGHGTSHTAKVTYAQMQSAMEQLSYSNAFIGTVEGEPEETACEAVIEAVKEAGYKKVVLRPLMVVAGDHANNDMAGDDEDSWKSMFEASGAFEEINCQIAGLGRNEAVQALYVEHAKMAALNFVNVAPASVPEDGTYTVKFDSDSSMFHINEAYDGCGTLTVKDGAMTLHMVMPSKNILQLYAGLAENAAKDSAGVINPTTETVNYADGTSDECYAFDVPVPYLEQEFDLALIGKKEKWYDHKVVVSTPIMAR